MPEVKLTQGFVALVDDEDFDEVSQFNWSITGSGYAQRSSIKGEYAGYRPVTMHRHLMKPGKGRYVDHINGNGLDNRRSNLRVCSNAENVRNRKVKNGAKGVTFQHGKWVAQITVDYKNIYLGRYTEKEDAMKAYDVAAKEHFGKFATLNFKESA